MNLRARCASVTATFHRRAPRTKRHQRPRKVRTQQKKRKKKWADGRPNPPLTCPETMIAVPIETSEQNLRRDREGTKNAARRATDVSGTKRLPVRET
jgi:hypothetical protein